MKINLARIIISTIAIIFAIGILCFISSCRSPEQLIQKAIDKGAVIAKDTVWQTITRFDTIIEPGTGEIRIVKVTDTIAVPVDRVIHIPLTRQERLAIRDEFKHTERMYKLRISALEDSLQYANKQSKQTTKQLKYERDKHRATEKVNKKKIKSSIFWTWVGKHWWIWYVVGIITMFLLRKFFNRFSLTLWNGKNK